MSTLRTLSCPPQTQGVLIQRVLVHLRNLRRKRAVSLVVSGVSTSQPRAAFKEHLDKGSTPRGTSRPMRETLTLLYNTQPVARAGDRR